MNGSDLYALIFNPNRTYQDERPDRALYMVQHPPSPEKVPTKKKVLGHYDQIKKNVEYDVEVFQDHCIITRPLWSRTH